MTAQEQVEKFLTFLQGENLKQEDAKKFLTLTQCEESKLVGKPPVEGGINGLYFVLKKAKSFKVDVKTSSNKVMKDVIVTLDLIDGLEEDNFKFQLRCVKESDIRKTSEDGRWGININSFKQI